MSNMLNHFLSDDDGAVTVDFVVLTSAIFMLGIVVVSTFGDETTDIANEVETALTNRTVPDLNF